MKLNNIIFFLLLLLLPLNASARAVLSSGVAPVLAVPDSLHTAALEAKLAEYFRAMERESLPVQMQECDFKSLRPPPEVVMHSSIFCIQRKKDT